MPTPENVFETLPAETLVTATGGVTSAGTIGRHDLFKLQHLISHTAEAQQNNQNQNMTMAMMMALAMRRQ